MGERWGVTEQRRNGGEVGGGGEMRGQDNNKWCGSNKGGTELADRGVQASCDNRPTGCPPLELMGQKQRPLYNSRVLVTSLPT